MLSLSWPRFRGSFIQKRFLAGLQEEYTYVPCKEGGIPYASWEFNPTLTREQFDEQFKRDPVLSSARFECNPPFAVDALFKDLPTLFRCFDAYQDEMEEIQHLGDKPIRTLGSLKRDKKYYVHVDLSLTQANCALAIAHNEGERVVLDLLHVWTPPPNGEVDIEGVEDFIISLKDSGYNIELVTFDGFQSANSIQTLNKKNIIAERLSVDRSPAPYHTLKDLVAQNLMDGYYDEALIKEILALDLLPCLLYTSPSPRDS